MSAERAFQKRFRTNRATDGQPVKTGSIRKVGDSAGCRFFLHSGLFGRPMAHARWLVSEVAARLALNRTAGG
ncbi:MAG: hypothetical protein RLY70_484 [Planctomycetota bacterium]|jgi:hypothetical protein